MVQEKESLGFGDCTHFRDMSKSSSTKILHYVHNMAEGFMDSKTNERPWKNHFEFEHGDFAQFSEALTIHVLFALDDTNNDIDIGEPFLKAFTLTFAIKLKRVKCLAKF